MLESRSQGTLREQFKSVFRILIASSDRSEIGNVWIPVRFARDRRREKKSTLPLNVDYSRFMYKICHHWRLHNTEHTYLRPLRRGQTDQDGCRTGRWGLWIRRTASLWCSARLPRSEQCTRTAPRGGWAPGTWPVAGNVPWRGYGVYRGSKRDLFFFLSKTNGEITIAYFRERAGREFTEVSGHESKFGVASDGRRGVASRTRTTRGGGGEDEITGGGSAAAFGHWRSDKRPPIKRPVERCLCGARQPSTAAYRFWTDRNTYGS